jgi:hypothetical protein
MYYFNVCGDANKVPEACVAVEKAVQSPAYQISHDSNCFWLGKLRSSEWELIDENEPAAGIELYYFDGEQCANGIARDFRIQVRAYATSVWGLKVLVYGALMYYFDGEQCANGIARDFRIQVPFTIHAPSSRY